MLILLQLIAYSRPTAAIKKKYAQGKPGLRLRSLLEEDLKDTHILGDCYKIPLYKVCSNRVLILVNFTIESYSIDDAVSIFSLVQIRFLGRCSIFCKSKVLGRLGTVWGDVIK